ncbi:MAG: amidohydrolase family protein [Candidatus Lokiarchaeota archaeon]|nr:amidohydrolase family protein [Candidatus Lokiarchaeota archaeon]MBD3339071.1 amidohydrolase family protein [Candidatus Lokiarchaeota archaeon]
MSEMEGNIEIFDAHMHYTGKFLNKNETLIEFMDRFGIDRAVINTLNVSANSNLLINDMKSIDDEEYGERVYENNRYDHSQILTLIKEHPERLEAFYWFNPRNAEEEDWKLLKSHILDYNFKGVKTQGTLDNLRIPDDFHALADFCLQHDIPLFFHSGQAFFYQNSYRAKDIFEFVKQYKDLQLILGHAAYTMEYLINVLRYFPNMKNVFFETSLSVPYGINVLIKVMGQKRVMYGSDAPAATTPDIEINKIKILNLKQDVLEDVFYNNINNLISEK